MPVTDDAEIEITGFAWVPDFAQGVVRDLRARWMLEEAGLDYRVQLFGQTRPPEYLREHPFDQVPVLRDGAIRLFESGAIVQYLADKTGVLLPADPQKKFRAIQWTYAALNSVEPSLLNLVLIDFFYKDQEWAKLRRAGAADFARLKLKRVSDWLGDQACLEGDEFTIGDLMMVSVLRGLRHTDIVAEFPNLHAYQARGEARPAFERALADQMANYCENTPEGVAA